MESKEIEICSMCGMKRPDEGKMLRCLHVSCLDCLNEKVTTQGQVQCEECRCTTSPYLSTVPLVHQLPSAAPLLYTDSEDEEQGEHQAVFCDYCDEADQVPATNSCTDCGNSLLCARHTALHMRRKPKHNLVKCDGEHNGYQRIENCLLHHRYPATDFCTVCTHPMCQQCKLHGHSGHEVLPLSEAADRQRTLMEHAWQEAVQDGTVTVDAAEGALRASSAQSRRARPVITENAIQHAKAEMAMVALETKTAAQIIKKSFAALEESLLQRKKAMLDKVDLIRQKQQESLEQRHKRLTSIQETQRTALLLANRLSNSELPFDKEACQLGGTVVTKLQALKVETDTATGLPDPVYIQTSANPADLHSLQAQIDSVIEVSEEKIDFDLLTLRVPEQIQVNNIVILTLHYDPPVSGDDDKAESASVAVVASTSPTSDATTLDLRQIPTKCVTERSSPAYFLRYTRPRVMSPSGLTDMVQLSVSATASCWEATFTQQPSEVGVYKFQLLSGEDVLASREFQVHHPVVFCQETTFEAVSISDERTRAAVSSPSDVIRIAYGQHSYVQGRWQWSFEVSGEALHTGGLAAGVAGTATAPNDASAEPDRVWFFWTADAATFISGALTDAGMATSKWQDGDHLTLTLDCNAPSLEIYMQRTAERKLLKWSAGTPCNDYKYVPYFRFSRDATSSSFKLC